MEILTRVTIILLVGLFLSGCDYIEPFQELGKARDFDEKGYYGKAIPHYENAIRGFAKKSLLKTLEYETRYSYALMLSEYTKNNNPEYIKVARSNYEWILEYLSKNKELISTRGMTLSSLANTYQQEAGYTEDEEKYFQLLEKAYLIYKDSTVELKKDQDWHNLAYTYYNLGQTSEWYGDLEEAIKWLEKAVELDKKYGFEKDLEEDSEYLSRLESAHREMLNKNRDAGSGADAPPPVR